MNTSEPETPDPSEAFRLGSGDPVLAIDVGGTDTKAALFDADGRMLGLSRTPTPQNGDRSSDAVLDLVAELVAALRTEFPQVTPRALGLIAPGVVDDQLGIGVLSTNLNWANVQFKALAEERFLLPTAFFHDVRAAGEAECTLGAGRGYRDIVVMVIGTGIAGALVLDGRTYTGSGYAGELGHAIVDPAGALCACGARGCLESIASAGAIARRYAERSGLLPDGAREVLARARKGDPLALSVWEEALNALAVSIAQLAATIAPEAIVIGGGLAQAGDELFVPLRERVDALLSFHRRPLLLPAQLGENAGLLGAGLRARSRLAIGAPL